MYKQVSIVILLVFLSAGVFCDSPDDSYNKNLDEMWISFIESTDSAVKAETLINIGILGKGNQNVIYNVNNYLMELSYLVSWGVSVDYMMVSASITAIMELGDSSSYPVLFSVLCAGYPEVIFLEAYGALDLIPGNLLQFLAGVIERNPPEEKFIAFKAGANSERLTASERGQLAELAFEMGFAAGEEDANITEMRYAAVLTLTSLRWTKANMLAIKHYYRVQTDFLQSSVPKARLIEAIACLGAVGNSDAALALGLQLGLINARTATTGIFDTEITLAIVRALGLIGDNAAFDHLLYTSNLPYSNDIKVAAREALARLKW
ncbi:MAG: hypothetical protein LBQ89_00260 [Treponema sp.]|jgi:hypothetical protein|nr:hypothetical protein [Treponema sp.]